MLVDQPVDAPGLFTFLTRPGFDGLWLALIGWFLIAAATAERHQATVRGQLDATAVRELMTPNPTTAPASMTGADLLSSCRARRPPGDHPHAPLR